MRILLISGSTRAASGNSAALRTMAADAPEGVTAVLYDGLAALPAFNPDEDQDGLLPAQVTALRAAIAAADAVLFCTPEYAGTLPGSFKNLLDWTVGGAEMYGKPAAWVNVAAPGRGEGATAHLALVLGYVGAAVAPGACRRITVPRGAVGPDGLIADPALRASLREALAALAALSVATVTMMTVATDKPSRPR